MTEKYLGFRTQPHDPEEFDTSLAPPALTAIQGVTNQGPLKGRRRIINVLSSFVLGQGATQGITLIIGLFLVRKLSVEAYAQFGIATGFQNVFSVLMDLGFASTIIPMVGDRTHDRPLIGRYVRAAQHLRDRTFWILAPVAAAAFFASVHKHHWSWKLQIALLASILLSLYSGGVVSFFSSPLLILGKLREYYVPQVISSAARLTAYGILAIIGELNAWTAAGLGAINVTLNAALIRRAGSRYLDWPKQEDPAADKELLRYVLPATPAIVFSAFQSQLSLFLISIFGSTLYIAEVTALGRIGQIFTVLTTFNGIVTEPYIARLPRERLLKSFLACILLATVVCSPLVLVAFRWPQVFLILLGPKFKGVLAPMGWYVLSSTIAFISNLIWIMNRARKWVFWSGSALEIVLLLAVQLLFILIVGVRTTQQAVFFAVASSGCYAVAHIYVSIRGFNQKNETE